MENILKHNILHISVDKLMIGPFNYNHKYAKNKIVELDKSKLLFKVMNSEYLFIPVLNKYIIRYGYEIIGHLIRPSYVGLYTAAKKWGFVKQENGNKIMYIADIYERKVFRYNYDKFYYYDYELYQGYKNALNFGLYKEGEIIYSDKEKTLLDLLYYSMYSKNISIDKYSIENTTIINRNKIDEYIEYYPVNSQNKILKKLKLIYPNL